jgi:hypothetical protein
MSEARDRDRLRAALNKHGLDLTEDELGSVVQELAAPKRKAKPVEDKPAAKPASYGTGKHKGHEKPAAEPKSYGTGKHPKPHDKQGS